MQWRVIKDFENYEVSDEGQIRNKKTKRILKEVIKHKRSRYGYALIYIYNKNGRKIKSIHRLVAEAFVPNPNNYPQVNHKDENSLNNKASNLEWCTAKYNMNYGSLPQRRKLIKNVWKGRKHKPESKLKMSLAKKGRPSSNCRKVKINGVEFPSVKCARETLHLSQRKIYKILKEGDLYV